MEWNYLPVRSHEDLDSFDWAPVEKVLDDIAARGNQTALRVYMEYPGRPSAIPEFLKKSGVALRKVAQWNSESPDYDDPRTIRTLISFIKAFGAKYDGDARIGFVTMGLVGCGASGTSGPRTSSFLRTPALPSTSTPSTPPSTRRKSRFRYGDLAGGYPIKKNVGFHDDSFFQKDNGKGVHASQVDGGQDWSFHEKFCEHDGRTPARI